MYIQYVGCDIAVSSRTYSFDVIDPSAENREFTVMVQSEAFRADGLKFQDGPGICFARLQLALDRETPELRAEAHLGIGAQDIQEYRAHHYPHKKTWGRS